MADLELVASHLQDTTSNQISYKDAISDIACGSIAGSMGKLIEYPFDTIKVRLQSQPDTIPLQYTGPIDCLRKSIKYGGFLQLYRGISSPIIGAAAENASLFFTYNLFLEWLTSSLLTSPAVSSVSPTASASDSLLTSTSNSTAAPTSVPFSISLLAGGLSGAVTSFILTPIELVKCRIQVKPLEKTSILGEVIQVWRSFGLKGFWTGQSATLIRETGGSAAYFGAYELVSSFFQKLNNRSSNTNLECMCAGASAGICYNFSLFPADTIKSRMQTMTNNIAVGGSTSAGFLQTGRAIYASGGISALYRGCGITLCRSAPASAIIFLTYEKLKALVI